MALGCPGGASLSAGSSSLGTGVLVGSGAVAAGRHGRSRRHSKRGAGSSSIRIITKELSRVVAQPFCSTGNSVENRSGLGIWKLGKCKEEREKMEKERETGQGKQVTG